MNCEYKMYSSLVSENNGVAQTGVTLSYTINPFGPSAGCVFISSGHWKPINLAKDLRQLSNYRKGTLLISKAQLLLSHITVLHLSYKLLLKKSRTVTL